ncbi:MAG TPA: response regulator [Terriglobales bacterium]|jgi:CheY-like chemotaxis protein|nr:response regulator [Terriglobales bacterium]
MSARKVISILLVDSDETLQGLRSLMLRLRGYQVDRVSSLADAALRAAQERYDMVIIDVREHPDAGLELCERLKATSPGLKVAFLADHTLYLPPQTCPDQLIARQDGPEHFLRQVDELLGASA